MNKNNNTIFITYEYKVKCSCGSSRSFTNGKWSKDRMLCRNCGKYIYKDKITENKYKFKEKMKGKIGEPNESNRFIK